MTNAFFLIGCAGIALAFALYIDSKPEELIEKSEDQKEKKENSKEKTEKPEKKKEHKITNKELYIKAKKQDIDLKNKAKIDEYNKAQEIYSGADDTSSKRLYFARQAYKSSRKSVPIVPVFVEDEDEEDEDIYNEVMKEAIEDEKKEEKEERVPVPPRNIKISKSAWEHRDPPSSVISSSFA
mgnify:FL=1